MATLNKGNGKLPPPPEKISKFLQRKVVAEADAKRAYASAAKIFERYHNQYEFSDNMEYKLGLLYDHRAMQLKRSAPQRAKKLYHKAEAIYRGILARNPNFLFAHHGLARVFGELKRYDAAIHHELQAYRLVQKLPKRKRGALGVGGIYLSKGDYKNAEKWFLKEMGELGSNDVGAVANVLMFYIKIKEYEKAFPYAMRLEKILKRMGILQKDGGQIKNKTIEMLFQRIQLIKKRASKKIDS